MHANMKETALLFALLGLRDHAECKKGLSVDVSKLAEGVGQLNNLASVDANAISEGMACVNQIWGFTLDVVAYLVLLYYIMGISSLGGLAAMALSVPMVTIATKMAGKYKSRS